MAKTATISSVFNINAPATAVVELGNGSNVPVDANYVFRPWLVKLMNLWFSGKINKRIYLYGPTGTGKSTIVEQYGARMGVPVYRIGVHNRLEFNDVLGCVQLVASEDKSPEADVEAKGASGFLAKIANAIQGLARSSVTTKFVHAELGQALVASSNQKVIVLIDEVDQGSPSQNMAWNKLLDECALTLPTGEVISPANVWIAATGNTCFEDERGLYRGTQRQNIAFMSRFGLHEEIGYPEESVEMAILSKVSPVLGSVMHKSMVEFANEMRKLFVEQELDVPLATRTLINWAKATESFNGMPGIKPFDRALELTYSNQCTSVDKQKIMGAWQRVSGT